MEKAALVNAVDFRPPWEISFSLFISWPLPFSECRTDEFFARSEKVSLLLKQVQRFWKLRAFTGSLLKFNLGKPRPNGFWCIRKRTIFIDRGLKKEILVRKTNLETSSIYQNMKNWSKHKMYLINCINRRVWFFRTVNYQISA